MQVPADTPTLSGPDFDATKEAISEVGPHALETRLASGTPFAYTPFSHFGDGAAGDAFIVYNGECDFGIAFSTTRRLLGGRSQQ